MIEPGGDPATELAEADQVAIPLALPPHRFRPKPTPLQACRLDRLSRAAHRFHRHAHHPLCDRYAGELVQLRWRRRRIYLCRGCTLAAVGGLLGGVIGLLFASPAISVVSLIAATALLIPTIASHRRLPKPLTRLAPAALFALSLTCSVLSHRWLLAALAVAVVVGLRLLYGRRGGDRTPCTTCPERTASPCSGFVQIVRREQAFQRLARRILE